MNSHQYKHIEYYTIFLSDLGDDLRLDSEFFNQKKISSKAIFLEAEKIIEYSDYGTSKELNEESLGMPTLRLNEFESLFIGSPSKFCNKENGKTTQRLLIKKKDIFICRTNGNPKYVGKAAISQNDYNYIFASYLFRIRTKPILSPEFLTVYLGTNFGRNEIEKYSMISNQANFSPAKFRQILIPIPSPEFQQKIEELVVKSYEEKEKGESLYKEAERILLQELNLLDFQPSTKEFNLFHQLFTIEKIRL